MVITWLSHARHMTTSHTHTPVQYAVDGATRYELHEDEDQPVLGAGAEIADDVLVLETAQNLHLNTDLLVLLWGREGGGEGGGEREGGREEEGREGGREGGQKREQGRGMQGEKIGSEG